METIGTFNGVVIYHYNFTNKDGKQIETTKVMYNVYGMCVFVNTSHMKDKKIGAKVISDLGYNGTKFVLL